MIHGFIVCAGYLLQLWLTQHGMALLLLGIILHTLSKGSDLSPLFQLCILLDDSCGPRNGDLFGFVFGLCAPIKLSQYTESQKEKNLPKVYPALLRHIYPPQPGHPHPLFNGKSWNKHLINRCGDCWFKISLMDPNDLCLTYLGREHSIFGHVQWLTLSWKVYKPVFLESISGEYFLNRKEKIKFPFQAGVSARILTQYLIELQGQDEHTIMLEGTSKAFKEATEAQAPIDVSSSASLLEDVSDSQLEERKGCRSVFRSSRYCSCSSHWFSALFCACSYSVFQPRLPGAWQTGGHAEGDRSTRGSSSGGGLSTWYCFYIPKQLGTSLEHCQQVGSGVLK